MSPTLQAFQHHGDLGVNKARLLQVIDKQPQHVCRETITSHYKTVTYDK